MENAELWARVNDLSRGDGRDAAEEFEDEISQMSGRCIDIGTGPGDVLMDFVLPKMNPDATVVCLDVSEKMLNIAKEKYQDNRRLSFVKLDIETPHLPQDMTEKFDHVTSFYCLHWCLDQRQVLENVFNLLCPEGTVILTSLAKFPSWNAYLKLAAMPRYQPYLQGDRYMEVFLHPERTRRTMESLVEDVGFEVRHCSVRERSYTFESFDALGEFMLSVNPFVSRMPGDLVDEFKVDLIREVVKHNTVFTKENNSQGEPGVLLVYYTFIVHLKKPLTN